MPQQTHVDQLPAVTGVTGADMLIMSSSSATKRVTVSQIGGYFQAAGVAGPTGSTGPESTVTGPTGERQWRRGVSASLSDRSRST